MIELSRSFRAMDTAVSVLICAELEERNRAELALLRIEALFAETEECLSRFRRGSELSRLNAAAGTPFRASAELFDTIVAALDAASETKGIYDPTILPALVAAGYDRSFSPMRDDGNATAGPSREFTWMDVTVDPKARTILIPAGCSLDLGGIAKGATVDKAKGYLRDFSGFAVDAGGDIRVSGRQADGKRWTAGVANPRQPKEDVAVIELEDEAVCTSSVLKRRWQRGGVWKHHIIDPRTGIPASSDILSATVVAPSAACAEVLAKAAIILGAEEGMAAIHARPGCQGLLVLEGGGALRTSKGLKAVCRAQ